MDRTPLRRRFWPKVLVLGPHECWPWQAAQDGHGYGQINAGGRGRPIKAHRVSYELNVGSIPDDLTVDHLCRNPLCVNPAHLEAVPERVNILRGNGWSGRKARQTHCIHGHPFDAENTYHWRGHRQCRACRREYDQRRRP